MSQLPDKPEPKPTWLPMEAVVVCVNYADFLAHTLPHNKSQFDRMVVVTAPGDRETINLCQYYNVECVETDVFYRNGDEFNKGAGINEGLAKLSMRGWTVHMDADIYMPPQTRAIIDRLQLDPRKIYGADRLMCPSYEAWAEFVCTPKPVQDSWVFIHPTAFPVGIRLAQYMSYWGGYEPLGYFQLWNPQSSGISKYPIEHGAADRTDVLFCKKWPRAQRELLPEILLIHLESTDEMGANWWGRRSPRFAPKARKPRKTLLGRIVDWFSSPFWCH